MSDGWRATRRSRFRLGRAFSQFPFRETGRVGRGSAASGEAVRLDPTFPQAHYFLGLMLAVRGRFAEALPALRRGQELGTKRPGWTYQSARRVADCEREVAAQAARTAPLPREVIR